MRPLTLFVFSSVLSVASVSTFFALVILVSCNSKPSTKTTLSPNRNKRPPMQQTKASQMGMTISTTLTVPADRLNP